MRRRRMRPGPVTTLLAAAVVLVLAAGAALVVLPADTKRAVAFFPATTGLYEGDEVRILGVPVGQIDSIEAEGDRVRVELHYDAEYRVPADAQAAIVAPTLVTSRYIQLAPRYTAGPVLADGAIIPKERTAVPVEWDEVKQQLSRVTEALGPRGMDRAGALSRAVGTAADSLDGQGRDINEAIEGLSRAAEVLADGRKDLFGTVRNLQVFVSALAASDQQIVEFNRRLASVSELLSDNREQLGTALADLRDVVATVEGFVRANREQLSTTVARLSAVSGTVAAQQEDLARALHVAPTPLVNLYNGIKPQTGSLIGQLAVTNFANPSQAVCSGVAAASNLDPRQATEFCARYLGPLLSLLTMNYPPVEANPVQRDGSTPTAGSPGERTEEPGRPPGPPAVPDGAAPAPPQGPAPDLGGLLLPGGGK